MKKELIFNIGFAIINFVIMIFVITFARGYSYNTNTLSIEKFGTIVIESDPQGSSVYLNNESIGITPIQKTLIKPGKYSVKLEKSGYRNVTSEIEITKDIVTKKYYKMINNDKQINSIYTASIKSQHFTQNSNYLVLLENKDSESFLYYIDLTKGPLDQILGNSNYYPTLISKLPVYLEDANISSSKDERSGLIESKDKSYSYFFNLSQNSEIIDVKKTIKFTPTNIHVLDSNTLVLEEANKVYYFNIRKSTLLVKYELAYGEKFNWYAKPIVIRNNSLLILDSSETIGSGLEIPLNSTDNLTSDSCIFHLGNLNNLYFYCSSDSVYIVKDNDKSIVKIDLSFPQIKFDGFINARETILYSLNQNLVVRINPITNTINSNQVENLKTIFNNPLIFSRTKDFGINLETKKDPMFVDLNFNYISTPLSTNYELPSYISATLTTDDSLILLTRNETSSLVEIIAIVF